MKNHFNAYQVVIFSLICFLCPQLFGQAGKIEKSTFAYTTRNGKELFLDKYQVAQNTKKQPCVIFMFGGSFRHGERDHRNYLPYFDCLAGNGYTVISIDYRLGLKDVKPANLPDVVTALKKAVDMAVEDLYDATGFVVGHAGEWNIDPSMIIASGSSAGAISVLQAEYENRNKSRLASRLPHGFQYAGVVSFAGAILSLDGSLKWSSKPAPILMFHGDADDIVPFSGISYENMSFCGSHDIAGTLDSIASPYSLFRFCGSSHEIANEPMRTNLPDILRLLDIMVLNHKDIMIRTSIEKTGNRKQFRQLTIEDFINSNFK